MPNIGPMEIMIVLVLALIILGPKKLPDAGRSLGRGMREFKDSLTGGSEPAERLPPASTSAEAEAEAEEEANAQARRATGRPAA